MVLKGVKAELASPLLWRDVLCELVGTFFLVAGHTAVGLTFDSSSPVTPVAVAVASGFTVYVIIDSLEHLSGGFINPVVSVSMGFARVVSPIKAFLCAISNCIGGLAGAALIYWTTPPVFRTQIKPLQLHPDVPVWRGVVIEFQTAALLLFVAAAVFDRKHRTLRTPALAIGFTVTANVLTFGKYTGAAMNPACLLGTATVSGIWTNHWVYWVGPMSGGVAGACLYTYVFALLTSKFSKTTEKQRLEGIHMLLDSAQQLAALPERDMYVKHGLEKSGRDHKENGKADSIQLLHRDPNDNGV